MKMLRFDPAGAIHPAYGVTQDQLNSLYPRLLELRRDWIEAGPTPLVSDENIESLKPPNVGFYRLPKEQLDDYMTRREASELGRVFKVATALKDVVDAVVVLGIGGSYVGPLALMDACCDPYHNELRRGPRGSKPRMYFEGNSLDNDTTQALLSRIAAGGYDDSAIEKRWMVIVISKSGETIETAAAFRQFLGALKSSLKGDDAAMIAKLVVPVAGTTGKLRDFALAIGCEEIFTVPDNVSGDFSVLSSVGLMPAAMLGLDCMKLLEGAVAMNEHFETTPPAKNVVLQYVAINHLLEQHHGVSTRVLSVWSKSLESVGHWYDQLLSQSMGAGMGEGSLGATPLTVVNTRDLHSRHRQHQQGKNNRVFNNLIVESHRTDPLDIGTCDLNVDLLNDIADKSLDNVLKAAIRGTNDALHQDGRPTTDIILPNIDTFALGQLFQMLMIATALECRLLGVDLSNRPGDRPYKSKMNNYLGRK